jgi:low affinity Fe/Cu permease
MKQETGKAKMGAVEKFSIVTTKAAGSSAAFVSAVMLILLWALTGPIFHYSETWQLVINTFTTIVTFLMVFLIQKTQNKDSLAIQLKLNELVAAHEFASNRLINAENITEEELKVIQQFYAKLSDTAKGEETLQQSHSIEEASDLHELKKDIEENIREHVKKAK